MAQLEGRNSDCRSAGLDRLRLLWFWPPKQERIIVDATLYWEIERLLFLKICSTTQNMFFFSIFHF